MDNKTEEKIIYRIFEWTLIIKAINCVWGITLGCIILFDRELKDFLFQAVKNEISEHPDNFLASYLENLLQNVTHSTELYIGIYLLVQGILKIVLIAGLLRRILWVYPLAMYIFLGFVFYQIYRYNHSHSSFLLIISALDIITILLINHEYKILKKTT